MQNDVKEALLDVLDMLGALTNPNELHGWGLSEERQNEIWELAQRLLQESQGTEL